MAVYCSLHHENPDGSAFCDECGEPLAGVAPVASAPAASVPPAPAPAAAPVIVAKSAHRVAQINPPGEAFCSNCGVSLLGAPAASRASSCPVTPAPAPQPLLTSRSCHQRLRSIACTADRGSRQSRV